MTPTHFTGLDLHKRTVTATTLDVSGAVVATAKMPCRPKALLAYFAQIPGDHAATVECTTGWYWVKDALGGHVDLSLAHAVRSEDRTRVSRPSPPLRSRPTAPTRRCWPIFSGPTCCLRPT